MGQICSRCNGKGFLYNDAVNYTDSLGNYRGFSWTSRVRCHHCNNGYNADIFSVVEFTVALGVVAGFIGTVFHINNAMRSKDY